ncbi:MAG TPA: redoxin domain-containing protein, partial [Candidatus Marinimicrobia bacterium]|nr:redoxin domain-containing protein [Candidatus Neomarinimicrobiota bacterium]
MKKLIFVVTLLLCFGIQAEELDLGSDLPLGDVKMMDISGKKVSLGEAKGENGLLVIFSCNTCPWVIKWEDRYVELAKKYQSKGVGMIALNSNETTFGS